MKVSDYKPLKVAYHRAGSDERSVVELEFKSRIGSPSALTWNYNVNSQPVFVNLTSELSASIEKILRKELEIQRYWARLPGAAKNSYLHTLLINEILSTNEIEGIHSTRQEIDEAIQAAEKSSSVRTGLRRFHEMAQTYLLLFGELESERAHFPTTLKELRSLYDKLLGEEISEDDQLDGEYFRKGTVSITDGVRQIHHGVTGEELIHAGVQTMLHSQQESNHVLVNAFVGHFILEHIHPFYDGNGRLGRFLLGLRLSEILSAPTAISLSSAVLREKNKYYKAFRTAEDVLNQSELTFFVKDMADILLGAMEELTDTLIEKLDQLSLLISRIQELGVELDDGETGVLFLLGQVKLFGPRLGMSMKELSAALGKSTGAIRPHTITLRDLGYIEELSKRPLVFALTEKSETFFGISE
ncbi:Fic family protein [Corynebacterium sp. L4756]|uniref:Fic family protein n=1 Tax=unclassified Corynebacterium TaxID=2624378 RepID=UPI00374CB2D1